MSSKSKKNGKVIHASKTMSGTKYGDYISQYARLLKPEEPYRVQSDMTRYDFSEDFASGWDYDMTVLENHGLSENVIFGTLLRGDEYGYDGHEDENDYDDEPDDYDVFSRMIQNIDSEVCGSVDSEPANIDEIERYNMSDYDELNKMSNALAWHGYSIDFPPRASWDGKSVFRIIPTAVRCRTNGTSNVSDRSKYNVISPTLGEYKLCSMQRVLEIMGTDRNVLRDVLSYSVSTGFEFSIRDPEDGKLIAIDDSEGFLSPSELMVATAVRNYNESVIRNDYRSDTYYLIGGNEYDDNTREVSKSEMIRYQLTGALVHELWNNGWYARNMLILRSFDGLNSQSVIRYELVPVSSLGCTEEQLNEPEFIHYILGVDNIISGFEDNCIGTVTVGDDVIDGLDTSKTIRAVEGDRRGLGIPSIERSLTATNKQLAVFGLKCKYIGALDDDPMFRLVKLNGDDVSTMYSGIKHDDSVNMMYACDCNKYAEPVIIR